MKEACTSKRKHHGLRQIGSAVGEWIHFFWVVFSVLFFPPLFGVFLLLMRPCRASVRSPWARERAAGDLVPNKESMAAWVGDGGKRKTDESPFLFLLNALLRAWGRALVFSLGRDLILKSNGQAASCTFSRHR